MKKKSKFLPGTAYKGYFNYFVLPDMRQVRSYQFAKLDGAQAQALETKFSNPLLYSYVGYKATLDTSANF